MNYRPVSFLIAGLVAVLVAGCTFPSSRRTVPGGQANVMQRVDTGTVVSVREVTIEGRRSQLGMVGGGLVGGALGSGGKGVSGAVVQAGSAVAGAASDLEKLYIAAVALKADGALAPPARLWAACSTTTTRAARA